METTTTTKTTSSFIRNIYRYSILSLLVLLILLVGCQGSASQLILTTLLLILIVILFEVFTGPEINVNVAKVEGMENVRGETFFDMSTPSPSFLPTNETVGNIILPSNEVTFDVPFDPRGLMIKKGTAKFPPFDIDYDVATETNFTPNNIQIAGGGDRYSYLNRGYMYEDHPGNIIVEQDDDLIVSPKFGKLGYFVDNGCNFGTVDTILN